MNKHLVKITLIGMALIGTMSIYGCVSDNDDHDRRDRPEYRDNDRHEDRENHPMEEHHEEHHDRY